MKVKSAFGVDDRTQQPSRRLQGLMSAKSRVRRMPSPTERSDIVPKVVKGSQTLQIASVQVDCCQEAEHTYSGGSLLKPESALQGRRGCEAELNDPKKSTHRNRLIWTDKSALSVESNSGQY